MQAPESSSVSRKQDILRQALKRRTPLERGVFLDGACGGDAALRMEIEALLLTHDVAGRSSAPNVEAGKLSQDAGTIEFTSALMDQTPMTEGPGTVIGRYKLLEKVGEGGMGVVYMAEQKQPVRRKVALKIIKLGMDTRQVVARFEAERQALAMMDHPNIAKVLDAGATETGRPYFVMELVRGLRITQFCDEKQFSLRERLDLFIKVCQAIQHAHQKGIIHRDIKPSNILVTEQDGVPVPKVIDFGIAKATAGSLTDKTLFTMFEQFLGTPAYMSPEQAEVRGEDIDTRSDIYSLGVVLYELLTGRTPFDSNALLKQGIEELILTLRQVEPLRPSTCLSALAPAKLETVARLHHCEAPKLVSSLRGDLDWILMKCLEKDRARRYETANGLAMDLQRHLKHEPVVARPPSVGYRLQKSFRRNRLVFTAAGVVGLALVLGVMVSTWQAIRATKAGQREAEAHRVADQAARVANDQRERAEKGELRAKESELTARQNLYASDMLLAQHVREDGNLDLALNLLNRHRPAPGESDLRGWEWRYLWSGCQSDEVGTFATNAGSVGPVVFAPDGSLLSAAEWGPAKTAVKLWGFPSGRLLATPETDDAASSVAFSPDGQLLAFGTKRHGLKLWNIQARQEEANFPGRYLNYHNSSLAFSPDGSKLAAASSAEPDILLWSVEQKTLASTFKGHSGTINSLVFSPDGKTLISASDDSTIRLWSLTSGQEIASLTNHTESINTLALSADGRTLASGGDDKTIRIWDLDALRQIAVLTNHTRTVCSVAFSPDGKTLASGSGDFSIKLWDTGRWQEVSTLRGSLDEVYALAFSRDGKTLVSGAKNGMIKTWNPLPQVRASDRLKRPGNVGQWWLGDGTLFCIHTNGAISYWNPSTFRQTAQYDAPQEVMTNSLDFSLTPSGRMVWASKQSEIVVWDLAGQRQLGRVPWVAGDEKYVCVSPNEKLLVAATAGNCLTVWDLEKLQQIANLPKSAGAARVVRFSRDLHLIAAGNRNGSVEVWDLSRKERVADWQAHRQAIGGAAFMPDGKRLVTVSWDAAARLWEVETGRQVQSFTRTFNAFFSVAISPDGQRIAAGTYDGLIKMWISSTGQEIATLRVGDQEVIGLQFLGPEGNTLISLTDREVRLWRAPPWEDIAAAEKRPEGKPQ